MGQVRSNRFGRLHELRQAAKASGRKLLSSALIDNDAKLLLSCLRGGASPASWRQQGGGGGLSSATHDEARRARVWRGRSDRTHRGIAAARGGQAEVQDRPAAEQVCGEC